MANSYLSRRFAGASKRFRSCISVRLQVHYEHVALSLPVNASWWTFDNFFSSREALPHRRNCIRGIGFFMELAAIIYSALCISTGNGKNSQTDNSFFLNIYDYPYLSALSLAQTRITVMAGLYRQKILLILLVLLKQEQ